DGRTLGVDIEYGAWNTLSAGIKGRFRERRFNGVVSGSYNRSDGHRADMDFAQVSCYSKLTYALSNHWRLAADLNFTHFDASNPGTVSSPLLDNDARIGRGLTSFSVENRYGRTSGMFSLYYNFGQH